MPTARERFLAKCEFMPGSGCVLWRGGTMATRDKAERTGVFWDGRRVLARRWAAEHIHGIDLFGKEVRVTCNDPLCVQHVEAICTGQNPAQFYVFVDIGLAEPLPPRGEPDHSGPPVHEAPAWLR